MKRVLPKKKKKTSILNTIFGQALGTCSNE